MKAKQITVVLGLIAFVLAAGKAGWADLDFGDTPTPYPTTLSEDGARHTATGPTLGSVRDSESDGTHSAAADADDTTGIDDEDGVNFAAIQVGQLSASVTVNVQSAPSGAKLDAWLDFNSDGCWSGPFEHIADSVSVANGDNTIYFDVPSWTINGQTYARFRLSTAGNLAPTGTATDGTPAGATALAYDNTVTLTLDQWHHIVGTYDGSTIALYLDGQPLDSKSASISIGTNSMPLSIGSWLGTYPFEGLIDEVRIYNQALNEYQVQALYQSRLPD